MKPIQMTTPLVEMDGDEMTRILWKMIKEELILPFVDLKSEYYDLGLPRARPKPTTRLPVDAANAMQKIRRRRKVRDHHAECAAHGANTSLKEMWKSPNGTIRSNARRNGFPRAHHHRQHQAGRSKPGKNRLPSRATPMATCTEGGGYRAPMSRERRNWCSPAESGKEHPRRRSRKWTARAFCRACTIWTDQSVQLCTQPASSMRSIPSRISGSAQKIPSAKMYDRAV